MLRELSWYLSDKRFTSIATEIDGVVREYAQALAGNSETGDVEALREKARATCEIHCERSGLRDDGLIFINIDSEFMDGNNLNEKALDIFIKEVIKAYCYQKVLWTYMGTTSTFTHISKKELKNQGIDYQTYLPHEYKKTHPEKKPLTTSVDSNTVPIYIYGDGTISAEYNKDKAPIRFDSLADKSGFDWKSGYDPNATIKKESWFGAFDEQGSWRKYNTSDTAHDKRESGSLKVLPIRVIKDTNGDGVSVYDPSGILTNPSQIVYTTLHGEPYGVLNQNTEEILLQIDKAITSLGSKKITTVYTKSSNTSRSSAYRTLFGNLAAKDLSVKPSTEGTELLKNEEKSLINNKKIANAIKTEQALSSFSSQGVQGKQLLNAFETGLVPIALNPRKKSDALALGLSSEEADYLGSLSIPSDKESAFNSAIANIFAAWHIYATSGLSKLEMADIIHKRIVHQQEDLGAITVETTFSGIVTPPVSDSSITIPGQFSTEQTVDFSLKKDRDLFLRSLEKEKILPKGGAKIAHEQITNAPIKPSHYPSITRALRNYREISMSTGMTIGEVINQAKSPDTTVNPRIHFELDTAQLITDAAQQNLQTKLVRTEEVVSITSPKLIVGGEDGVPLGSKGFTPLGISKLSGMTEKDSIKAKKLIDSMYIVPGIDSTPYIAIVKQVLKQAKGKGYSPFRTELVNTLNDRNDVSYNLASKQGMSVYTTSQRFKASGLSHEDLDALLASPTQENSTETTNTSLQTPVSRVIAPVYTSSPGVVPINRSTPKGIPEPIQLQIITNDSGVTTNSSKKNRQTEEMTYIETINTALTTSFDYTESNSDLIPSIIVGSQKKSINQEVTDSVASIAGLTAPRLASMYGYSDREAKKTHEYLSSLAVPKPMTSHVKQDLIPSIRAALKTNKTTKKLTEAVTDLLANRNDVAYEVSSQEGRSSFMRTPGYKDSGIEPQLLDDRITRIETSKGTSTPVYAVNGNRMPSTFDAIYLDKAQAKLGPELNDTPIFVVGGEGTNEPGKDRSGVGSPTSLAQLAGYSAPSLMKGYGYTAMEAEKASSILRNITVPEGKSGFASSLLGDVSKVIAATSSASDMRESLSRYFSHRNDVAYNLSTKEGSKTFAATEQFKNSGYSLEDLSLFRDRLRHGTSSPIYALPLDSRRVAQQNTDSPISRTVSDVPTSMSATGISVSEVSSIARGKKPAVSAMSNSAYQTVKATPETPSPFPATKADKTRDTELERLKRIEANYEKDKAMLAKEKAPALARSASHDIGHAEGIVDKQTDNPEKIGKQLVDTFISEVKGRLI